MAGATAPVSVVGMPTPPHARRSSPVPRPRRLAGPARVAVALSSLALLGLLPTAAYAAGWVDGPRFAVAAGSTGGDFVAAPDGSSTVSWFSGRDGLLPVIQVQHARADGTVTAPLALGSGVSPALATSTANATAVGWIGSHPWDDDRAIRVTLLDQRGAVVRTTTLATLTADEAGEVPSVDVALDAAGRVTVVWTRTDPDSGAVAVEVAVVSPRGVASEPVTLGETTEAPVSPPTVVSAPNGPAWAGWITPDSGVEVARLNRDGGVDAPATRASADDERAAALRLSASAAGAAIAWVVPDPDGDGDGDPSGFPLARVAGARLAASGALVGARFGVGGAIDVSSGGAAGFGSGVGLAVGPDGTVSLGWTRAGSDADGLTAMLSRFAPGQVTATSAPLGRSNGLGSLAPRLGAAPDGSLLASWLRLDGLEAASVAGARIAPDGTIETAPHTVTSAPFDGGFLPPQLLPQADDHGAGIIGVGTSFPGGAIGWSFSAFRLDVVGPTVTVDGPPTTVVRSPVRFVARVADPANAPLTWDFGDGASGSGRRVDHAYATPGTYAVTTRATDEVANETVVTREITVTAAPVGSNDGPGGPTPPVATPPSSPTAAVAALKVTKATRDGAKVTVSGTISSRAQGRLSVRYAQRVGRSTVGVERRAAITKGRWRTTLTLPRSLTAGKAAKRRGTVTATFAGTATVERATAKRTVVLAKARRPARVKR